MPGTENHDFVKGRESAGTEKVQALPVPSSPTWTAGSRVSGRGNTQGCPRHYHVSLSSKWKQPPPPQRRAWHGQLESTACCIFHTTEASSALFWPLHSKTHKHFYQQSYPSFKILLKHAVFGEVSPQLIYFPRHLLGAKRHGKMIKDMGLHHSPSTYSIMLHDNLGWFTYRVGLPSAAGAIGRWSLQPVRVEQGFSWALLLLLLPSHVSRVRLCATPYDGSPCPWDSPGKNSGVGCHFPLQWMKVKTESEVAQSCPTLRDPMDGSSVALDNFLLCLTVEGPKTETLAVSSFPKVHDFCNPSPLRNGTLFKAGI